MKASARHRLLLFLATGAALAHTLLGLWAGYFLVVGRFGSGRWWFSSGVAYMLFRIIAAFLVLLGLGTIVVALRRKAARRAILPAAFVCIVSALIPLQVAALWAKQTEVLSDGLPELAASAAIILAALTFGHRWSCAKYAARATVLALIGLYGVRYWGLVDLLYLRASFWHILVECTLKLSEFLALALPLVMLDLLSGTEESSNQLET